MNITESNLVPVTAQPKPGQRVIQIAPGKWIPVGLGGITPSVSSNSTSYFLAIEAGYIDANGNFQSLSFNGTQASDSGSAVQGLQHKIFNTGHEEPDYGGPGGVAMEFYKCSYVNSDSWGGYKAIQDPVTGIYSFESAVTSGLLYGLVVPQAGKVYADGALVEAKLFTAVLFDVPLYSSEAEAETGQALYDYDVTYPTDSSLGHGVASFEYGVIETANNAIFFPSGAAPFSVTFATKAASASDLYYAYGFYNGTDDHGQGLRIDPDNAEILFTTHGGGGRDFTASQCDTSDLAWHTVAVTYDSTTLKIYFDGTLKMTQTTTLQTSNNTPLYLGKGYPEYSGNTAQYMFGFQVWQQCLTAEDVQQIHAELLPSAN